MIDVKAQLQTLFDRVGSENIWRTIYDVDGTLLADGYEDTRDCSPDDLAHVNFCGKHVLDLGCNFGYYSFLVKRLGAASVVGVDIDPDVIRGCRLLNRLYNVSGLEFLTSDFTDLSLETSFDCTLLINFIGKRSLCKGIVPLLEIVCASSHGEIILSVRPVYNISSSLQVLPEQLVALYGAEYVRGDSFFLAEFLQDFFRYRWHMAILSPEYDDRTLKRTLLFTPLSGSRL